MRIALVSTCAVAVPPKAYGGTELVVAELAKGLSRLGHHVTVFATGDSRPAGELRHHFRTGVWPPCELVELRHAAFAWAQISAEDPPFDVVHVNEPPAIAFTAVCATPTVATVHHDRVDRLVEYYCDFCTVTYVAISRRQAELMPEIDIRHVVHHGLDPDLYEAGDGAGGWLAFVGRFAPEKGPHAAIDVALAAGLPLRMGGRPHWVNEQFMQCEVVPRLERAGDRVRWLGELSFRPKLDVLRGAVATLFPVQWEEPFGLVMIESMLVGTPVVAFSRGAAPEVVEDGITGFLARDAREMVAAVRRVGSIDRERCRRRARERFSTLRMARDYERIYDEAMRRHARSATLRRARAPQARAEGG